MEIKANANMRTLRGIGLAFDYNQTLMSQKHHVTVTVTVWTLEATVYILYVIHQQTFAV